MGPKIGNWANTKTRSGPSRIRTVIERLWHLVKKAISSRPSWEGTPSACKSARILSKRVILHLLHSAAVSVSQAKEGCSLVTALTDAASGMEHPSDMEYLCKQCGKRRAKAQD